MEDDMAIRVDFSRKDGMFFAKGVITVSSSDTNFEVLRQRMVHDIIGPMVGYEGEVRQFLTEDWWDDE